MKKSQFFFLVLLMFSGALAMAADTIVVATLVDGTTDTWGSAFVTDPAYVTPPVDLDGTQATEFIHIGGSAEYANLTNKVVGDVSTAQYLEFDLFVKSVDEPLDEAWINIIVWKDPYDGANWGNQLEYPGLTGTVGSWVHRKIAMGDLYSAAGMDWSAGGILQLTTTSTSGWNILIDNLVFTRDGDTPPPPVETTPVVTLIDGANDAWGSSFVTDPVYVTPTVDLDGTQATEFIHIGGSAEYANLTNMAVGDVSSAQYLEFDLFVKSVDEPLDQAWINIIFWKDPYDGANWGNQLEYPGLTGTVGEWVHRRIAMGDLYSAAGMDWSAGGILQLTTTSTSGWNILIDNLAFTKEGGQSVNAAQPQGWTLY